MFYYWLYYDLKATPFCNMSVVCISDQFWLGDSKEMSCVRGRKTILWETKTKLFVCNELLLGISKCFIAAAAFVAPY